MFIGKSSKYVKLGLCTSCVCTSGGRKYWYNDLARHILLQKAKCYITVVREIFVRDNLAVKFICCILVSWASYSHENILPLNFPQQTISTCATPTHHTFVKGTVCAGDTATVCLYC